MKINFTNKQLHEIIKKNIKDVLNEGIDFDENRLTVSYNPSHEDNIETSEETNPTMVSKYGDNVEVWSIFKRKSGRKDDGNPLVYALKGEGGWKFKTNKDKNAIYSQIEKITAKFFSTHSSNVTIILPSEGRLNSIFANIIMSYNKGSIFIDNLMIKMDTDEVRRLILLKDSPFRKAYNTPDLFERALAVFDIYADKMGDKYRTHLMHDKDIRSVVEKTIRINYPQIAKYFDSINNKDVLVIDDNIGRGSSIKVAIRELKNYYSPNSITFLTLFSERYDPNGNEVPMKKLNYKFLRRRMTGKGKRHK
jgi:hypothetical protein